MFEKQISGQAEVELCLHTSVVSWFGCVEFPISKQTTSDEMVMATMVSTRQALAWPPATY